MLLFSHSVLSDSLKPDAASQAFLSFTICRSMSKLMSLSRWCHPATSSSVIPFSSCPQKASESLPMSQLFTSHSQRIGALASASVLPMNIQEISFRTDLLAVQGTLKSLLQHHSSKASILQHSAFFMVQLSHLYTTAGKTIALTMRTFVSSHE